MCIRLRRLMVQDFDQDLGKPIFYRFEDADFAGGYAEKHAGTLAASLGVKKTEEIGLECLNFERKLYTPGEMPF